MRSHFWALDSFKRTTSTKFIGQDAPELKSEIRSSKSETGLFWNFLIFDHLKLFRISDFELRICNFYTWRALRLRVRQLFAYSVIQGSTKNFKYLWLAFSCP